MTASGVRLGEIAGIFGEELVGVVAVVEKFRSIVPQIDAESCVFFMCGEPAGSEDRLFADGFRHSVGLACKGG